jgi:2-polyprenyl-3-methyl-5-hydroxy-6-metoxy-1,4-benzoquinol methylase
LRFSPAITKPFWISDAAAVICSTISRTRSKPASKSTPEARKVCQQFGFAVYASKPEVPDGHFDVIISNHPLGHCARPLDEITGLKGKLKPRGRMVFFVPRETSRAGYSPRDPNYHLYTWSPMNLGNLFAEAGLEALSAGAYNHRQPPRYETLVRLFGRRGFEFCCRIHGLYKRNTATQSYCVVRRG